MQLQEIYRPVERELSAVEEALKTNLKKSQNGSVVGITDYLLSSRGKRIRPALVTLSAKAALRRQAPSIRHQLIRIASAVELIHLASLIHDDVIDHSLLRHHKPTVNSKWGEDVAIVLGDYLYSVGFGLISSCQNTDILSCISQATRVMCEGELIQVCERDNIDLLKKSYLIIVKNKTARLFAASCQAGAIIADCREPVQTALKQYGLNFGIAFQIVDDSLDLIARPEELGKSPGADFKVGELTLPVLNLLSQYKDKRGIINLIRQKHRTDAFREIRQRFIDSRAYLKTKEDVSLYVRKAKRSLEDLEDSSFKQSLFGLTDYVAERMRI